MPNPKNPIGKPSMIGRRRKELMPRDPLCELLGDAFARQRTRSNISLRDLAEKMERTINTIRYHENGYRMLRIDELVRAAEIMGCSISSLTVVPAR